MAKKKVRPNRDEWRNSIAYYKITLARRGYVLTDKNLCHHIDYDTMVYKQWPVTELKVLLRQDDRLELSNCCRSLTYKLIILIKGNQLQVSCSCKRKVDKLCHHAYYALLHIINQFGIQYFKPK